MAKALDYTAKVFEISDNGLVVHYSCGERDKYGVTIPIPEGFEPTPSWVRQQIHGHSGRAFAFWDKQDRNKDVRARKARIQAAIGKVVHAGLRPEPPAPKEGLPDVVEL